VHSGVSIDDVARILVFWVLPPTMPEVQADAWARTEAERLVDSGRFQAVELVILEPEAGDHFKPHDRLLELRVASTADAHARVGDSELLDLLSDMRMLGMRPGVAIAPEAVPLAVPSH
jgi:hypothetical protein